MKEGADALVDLIDGEVCGGGEWFEAEGFVDVVADVVEELGEALEVGVGESGDVEIAGDADEADDIASVVEEGFLVGEAPVFAPVGVEVSFELAVEAAGFLHDLVIFLDEAFAERWWEEFGGGAADEGFTIGDAAAGEEGLVDGEVSALRVLDEKGDIVDVVEEPLHGEGGAEALEEVLAEFVGGHGAWVIRYQLLGGEGTEFREWREFLGMWRGERLEYRC